MARAMNDARELNKTVRKEIIEVIKTTYFKQLDVYTGKNVICKNLNDEPLIKRQYLVKVYGYLIV
jgi:hypothetical protein